MAQPQSVKEQPAFTGKPRFLPTEEASVPEDTYEGRFEALQRTDERHEARLNGIDARADGLSKDFYGFRDLMIDNNAAVSDDLDVLTSRIEVLEAHVPSGEYNFGKDVLERLSSRKFLITVAAAASALILLAQGQIDAQQALVIIGGAGGTFMLAEGAADVAGRIKGGQQ